MKASNKYLFDQTVSCENCKHLIYELNTANCKLNPTVYSNIYKYKEISTIRYENILSDVTKYCGPIGKYYESKE